VDGDNLVGDGVLVARRDWRIGIAADADSTLAAHILLRPRICKFAS
jgi:hypothetical protein